MPRVHLASFRADVTVPIGHPLCGGWIKPAVATTEPLLAKGIVLLGDEAPVVLCAVDWTGICNDAHVAFREKIATAAHTTPERVALHAVHQHNAPFVDLTGQRLVSEQKDLSPVMDKAWFDAMIGRVCDSVQQAMARMESVTHVSVGQGKVERVASNRRLLGVDGKIRGWRGSSCREQKLRAEPEGLIDPQLKSFSFWNEQKKLVTLSYYATHPMSYYGDGMVTSDFVGLAREAREKETGIAQIYFTGCSGNIAAGKYNDGDHANRFLLAQRIYAGMAAGDHEPKTLPLKGWHLAWESVVLPPRSNATELALRGILGDGMKSAADRARAALRLSYLLRARAKTPIELTCLRLNEDVYLLHLPGECFIEYQLAAQERRKDAFVAVAAYGDDGPWYVPTAKAYPEGGYEPSASFVDPESEGLLRDGMGRLLG